MPEGKLVTLARMQTGQSGTVVQIEGGHGLGIADVGQDFGDLALGDGIEPRQGDRERLDEIPARPSPRLDLRARLPDAGAGPLPFLRPPRQSPNRFSRGSLALHDDSVFARSGGRGRSDP